MNLLKLFTDERNIEPFWREPFIDMLLLIREILIKNIYCCLDNEWYLMYLNYIY
jgi:hypothetical protein